MDNNKEIIKVVVGKKIIDKSNDTLIVYSPINKQMVGLIPKISSKKQIDLIYKNAKIAFYQYRQTSFLERKKRLLKFCSLLEKNKSQIINFLIWEIAKPRNLAQEELSRSIEYIKQTIIEYKKIISSPMIIDKNIHKIENKIGIFNYKPVGVVLAISPFNYPLNLLISKIIPALISGNVVVYKPATQGSCLGAYVSTLLYESGFANGEISCVIGKGSDIGDALIENSNIDMISFTGSTKIGINIAQKNPLIPVVLELGGKDAAIVLEDANLEDTAKEIVKGALSYNGQRCTAIKRVFVHSKIKGKLIDLINKEVKKLKVGSAKDGDFNITEMIDQKSVKYNLDLIHDAQKNKAKTNQEIKTNGNILFPVVLYDVNLKSRIAWEEQFGPVLPIITFNKIDDAIENCNQSEFGLQTSIFTKNIKKAKEIASLLDVFTVNINKSSSRYPDAFPFGGIKKSGKGIQGIKESILSMNQIKGIIENH